MSEYRVVVQVVPRAGILDPQGNAVAQALGTLGFDGVSEVHVGRVITLHLAADDEADARARAEAMCRQLLANPVTEDFQVEVRG